MAEAPRLGQEPVWIPLQEIGLNTGQGRLLRGQPVILPNHSRIPADRGEHIGRHLDGGLHRMGVGDNILQIVYIFRGNADVEFYRNSVMLQPFHRTANPVVGVAVAAKILIAFFAGAVQGDVDAGGRVS